MKVKELVGMVYEEVIFYKPVGEPGEYKNIFKGRVSEIPESILEMEIQNIGVKKGALDICVRT